MRTFNIYSLGNFQVYITVLLTLVIVLHNLKPFLSGHYHHPFPFSQLYLVAEYQTGHWVTIVKPCCCFSVAKSYPTLQLYGLWPTRLLYPWDFPGNHTGMGCHFLSISKIVMTFNHSSLENKLPSDLDSSTWGLSGAGSIYNFWLPHPAPTSRLCPVLQALCRVLPHCRTLKWFPSEYLSCFGWTAYLFPLHHCLFPQKRETKYSLELVKTHAFTNQRLSTMPKEIWKTKLALSLLYTQWPPKENIVLSRFNTC